MGIVLVLCIFSQVSVFCLTAPSEAEWHPSKPTDINYYHILKNKLIPKKTQDGHRNCRLCVYRIRKLSLGYSDDFSGWWKVEKYYNIYRNGNNMILFGWKVVRSVGLDSVSDKTRIS